MEMVPPAPRPAALLALSLPGNANWAPGAWPGLTMPPGSLPPGLLSQGPLVALETREGRAACSPHPVWVRSGVMLGCLWGEPLSLVYLRADTPHLPGQWWLQARGVSSLFCLMQGSPPRFLLQQHNHWEEGLWYRMLLLSPPT